MEFVVYSQWSQLPDSASLLFAECEKDSLFFSRIWLENLTAHALADHQSIRLICVVEGETILAILPMIESSRDGLRALSNHFTTLYSLLIFNHSQQDAVMTCMAKGLSRMSVSAIRLEPIDVSDSNMIKLSQCMEACGFKSHYYFRFYNWRHPVNGQSFNEYMAERPANIQNMIKRKQRKLEREQEYEIRLYQNLQIDRALADYQEVYLASWKANEYFTDFTPSLVHRLSEMGWLRLAILYIEEKPVAAQIWVVVHGKANIYRLAYDQRWKNYSPGSILTQYLMRHVIDTDKVVEIDFLTGNERYKQDWMSVQKELAGTHFVKELSEINWFGQIIKLFMSKR
ncbi:MAG: GNAT family N-acetyltransferase [Gammaproteobacteria bacterium]|nr:GNAT family N-acetyltransferase [Gammaproteobacteria bacterium]